MWVKVMANWGLSIDPRHEEIIKVLTGHLTRQKFAERIASTICRRNAMKRHPAIGKSEVVPRGGEARIPVFGWQHDLTAAQINTMAQLTSSGALPKQIELRSEETEVEYGKSEVAAVEHDVVADNIGTQSESSSPDDNEQGSLFSEDDSLSDRDRSLIYLGGKEEELGNRQFREIVGEVVQDIDSYSSLSELSDEAVDLATEELKKWEHGNK